MKLHVTQQFVAGLPKTEARLPALLSLAVDSQTAKVFPLPTTPKMLWGSESAFRELINRTYVLLILITSLSQNKLVLFYCPPLVEYMEIFK